MMDVVFSVYIVRRGGMGSVSVDGVCLCASCCILLDL